MQDPYISPARYVPTPAEFQRQEDAIKNNKPVPIPDRNALFAGYLVDLVDKVAKVVRAHNSNFAGVELVPLAGYSTGSGKQRVEYYAPLVTGDDECNCSGEYFPVTGRSYSRFQDRWNGLMGQVTAAPNDRTMNLAVGPMVVTANRSAAVRFTQPFLTVGMVMIAQREVAAAISLRGVPRSAGFFLAPFDVGIWLFIPFCVLIVGALVALNARFNPREVGAHAKVLASFDLLDSYHLTISTFLLQGYRTTPHSLAGRVLMYVWWFFAIIFFCLYFGGVMIALIGTYYEGTVNSRAGGSPVHSMDEAIRANYTFSAVRDGGAYSLLRHSADHLAEAEADGLDVDDDEKKLISTIWYHLKSRGDAKLLPDNPTELLQQVKESAKSGQQRILGLLESADAGYNLRTDCDLVLVGSGPKAGGWLEQWEYAFAFPSVTNLKPKEIDFYDQVNRAIIQLGEMGMLSRLYAKWFMPDPESCGGYDSNNLLLNNPARATTMPDATPRFQVVVELAELYRQSLPITLATFWGPLLYLLCGVFLAILIAVAETFYYIRIERYQAPDVSMQRGIFSMQTNETDDPQL